MEQRARQSYSSGGRRNHSVDDFDSISLRIASPERIREWSHGEVTKPETINYRTQRSEKNGLFDESIFGPEQDYECSCKKYRGIRYKGIVCEKCNVEVTRSIVRRERMGHIELSTPVSHIWFLRGIPSRISLILGLSAADVEKVIYFAGYIITKVIEGEKQKLLKELDQEYKNKIKDLKDEKTKKHLKDLLLETKKEIESLTEGRVLHEADYHKFSVRYGLIFEAKIGAEAIYEILKKLDLVKFETQLTEQLEKAGSVERVKLNKRLSLIRGMISSDVRPEWMFLTVIPIIPPALRPMVALEGGRHATSDVNDLYRRVINRNNRLKKLIAISAPDVILRNEKRILQEAVDALLDNSIRHGNTAFSAMSQAQRRPLKSLSDYLKGKQGYFRSNLLGKRVDYSGRSVIVVGPDLALDECGLPKHMALELFRPFVIERLLNKELAYNIRGAGRFIDEGEPEVWAILEDVIKGKYVLLNRAPTLHRQGIQAFKPILIEGDAIQLPPLVCPAFNADFDGDQMAVHVPLSEEAQFEAREIMSANKNILKPGNGEVVTAARHDVILGCYWMTRIIDGERGEDKIFTSPNSAITAYDFGVIDFRAKIKVLPTDNKKYAGFEGQIFETSVGRLLFNSVLPSDFAFINDEMTNKKMASLIDQLIEEYGLSKIPDILNKIKKFGFRYATESGITWGLSDLGIPEGKADIIKESHTKIKELTEQYNEGLLSKEEKKRMSIEIWQKAKAEIEGLVPETLDRLGSVHDMLSSGARGSMSQIAQMTGMKGLITSTSGETIEFPIIASMKEGLTPIEYFITTHGSRKGLADTALQTAKAGYLTRRLFDVAQDAIIVEDDCGTKDGTFIKRKNSFGMDMPLAKSIRGRYLNAEIKDKSGETLFSKGHLLTINDANALEESDVDEINVRTPMACKSSNGICVKCYGADLTTWNPVFLGEAVGTVAAQAIGEPGTQLTMRTFHAGGTASVGGDITQGLPRVEEIFERRIPKNPAAIARISGVVSEIKDEGQEKVIVLLPDVSEKAAGKSKKNVEYPVHFRRVPLVKVNQHVEKGEFLTDGSAEISELFKYGGKERTQEYIISEVNRIYELQGASISRKHIEVIIKQMFSRRKIKASGDTVFTVGEVVEERELIEKNEDVKTNGGTPATVDGLVLGITEVSITRKSFLSAASFQNTTKVLINASVKGRIDRMRGLKENVIIGRLIPAGTGRKESPKARDIQELQEELEREYQEGKEGTVSE